ncbi:MAG: divergent PAP2 family protein [Candidatus Gastranaerophilaceae bacterium]|jgi:hypothetical protein
MANTSLEVIIAAFTAAFTAQILKLFFYYLRNKKINFKLLAETGGMPSSHSAGVVALSTSVGLILGFDSVDFAIAFGYAMIVMYDAAGLRRSTGQIAAQLNRVVDTLWTTQRPYHSKDKLMELLGHTPLEVFMGALLGITISLLFHYSLLS